MASPSHQVDPDTISDDENSTKASSNHPHPSPKPSPTPKNAFTELLTPKPKPPNPKPRTKIKSAHHSGPPTSSLHDPNPAHHTARNELAVYIVSPASFSSRVLYHNDRVVAIRDLYPKSSVHLLLLPKSDTHTRLHPFDALQDTEFLRDVILPETAKLKRLAAEELRRRHGGESKSEEPRRRALDAALNSPAGASGDDLPRGRDWDSCVMAGVHSHPSMNHLHVHVLSVDRRSERMKHRKHYNSFATGFFVGVEEFPLGVGAGALEGTVRGEETKERDLVEGGNGRESGTGVKGVVLDEDKLMRAKADWIADQRRRAGGGREGFLAHDMKCWRCGRNFGNRFKELKEHLEAEFDEWKRE